MNIVVKKESIEEAAPKIFELDQQIFVAPLSFPSKNVEEVHKAFKNCVVYMAYSEGKVVGFLAYEKREDGSILLKAVGIVPNLQGQGIGKKLMDQFLTEVKDATIQLHTHPRNKSAIQFYWKFGFAIVGWKSDYFGPGEHRLLMQKGEL